MKTTLILSTLLAGMAALHAETVILNGVIFDDVVRTQASSAPAANSNEGHLAIFENTGIYSGPAKSINGVWIKDGGSYKGNNNVTVRYLKVDGNYTFAVNRAAAAQNEIHLNQARFLEMTGSGWVDIDSDAKNAINFNGMASGSHVYLNVDGTASWGTGTAAVNAAKNVTLHATLTTCDPALSDVANGNPLYTVSHTGNLTYVTRRLFTDMTLDTSNLAATMGDWVFIDERGRTLQALDAGVDPMSLVSSGNLGKYWLSSSGNTLYVNYIVPEPSGISLALFGTAGLLLRRRRRR